eukprot:scaffold30550_cov66-Phaeocystis_antarctica.AAC.7
MGGTSERAVAEPLQYGWWMCAGGLQCAAAAAGWLQGRREGVLHDGEPDPFERRQDRARPAGAVSPASSRWSATSAPPPLPPSPRAHALSRLPCSGMHPRRPPIASVAARAVAQRPQPRRPRAPSLPGCKLPMSEGADCGRRGAGGRLRWQRRRGCSYLVSRNAPPPLPGGYKVGEKVFFTAASQTLPNGDKLVHGQQGEVTGPATVEIHKGKGVNLPLHVGPPPPRRLRRHPPPDPHTRDADRALSTPAITQSPGAPTPIASASARAAAQGPGSGRASGDERGADGRRR